MESIHLRRGFSLIELVVVVAIIGVIMSIVLNSQSSFNKTIILTNTAYDIALTLRSAQTFGLGSRAAGVASNAGYGVHVQNAPATTFTLFSDTYPPAGPSNPSLCHPTGDPYAPDSRPGNCVYDPNNGEDPNAENPNNRGSGKTYTLGNGITISNFCAYSANGRSCASDGSITSLDIIFVRPNSDPFMSTNGSYSSVFPIKAACLVVSSPQSINSQNSTLRFVYVGSSGEITANATECPP